MKEDITQRARNAQTENKSCGLVMKEDITQPQTSSFETSGSCGLVMKEDITQLTIEAKTRLKVVVW